MGFKKHVGKVKSHTGVTHNEEADTAARNVVEGNKLPDILFTDAEPPIGGFTFFPQLRATERGSTPTFTQLSDLHSSLCKLIKTRTSNSMTNPSNIYGNNLHKARDSGADHTSHACPNAPYRARRDSLEVTRGVHIHRCRRKYGPSLICTKRQSPLSNMQRTHT